MSEQPGNIPGTDVPYSTLRGGMQSLLQTASSKENLQNALPGLFADGGRPNFSNGGMSRRTFLKFLVGLAAVPVIGKFEEVISNILLLAMSFTNSPTGFKNLNL